MLKHIKTGVASADVAARKVGSKILQGRGGNLGQVLAGKLALSMAIGIPGYFTPGGIISGTDTTGNFVGGYAASVPGYYAGAGIAGKLGLGPIGSTAAAFGGAALGNIAGQAMFARKRPTSNKGVNRMPAMKANM